MTGSTQQELSAEALADFAHSLASRQEIGDVLYRLTEHAITALGADGGGTWLATPDGVLHPATAVNQIATELEASQQQHAEGPGIDAFTTRDTVRVEDLELMRGTWPKWTPEARRRGIRAVLSVPLMVRDRALGALCVLSRSIRPWADRDLLVAGLLTDMASSYVAHVTDLAQFRRTAEQLQIALDSRVIIEQAKGMLASALSITVDEAFVVLRKHARRNGLSLRLVADTVVRDRVVLRPEP